MIVWWHAFASCSAAGAEELRCGRCPADPHTHPAAISGASESETNRELGELTAKLDALCATLRDHIAAEIRWQERIDAALFGPEGLLAQQSARIRVLERWRDGVVAVLAVFATVAAMVSTWWAKR